MTPSKKHAFQLALAAGLFIAVASWVITMPGCGSLPVQPTPVITPAPTYSPVAESDPSPAATVNPAPSPILINPGNSNVSAALYQIVQASSCRNHDWSNGQGIAPRAFLNGMALTFAHAACANRAVVTHPVENTDEDGLHIYALAPTLPNVYALLIGSGMMESSGRYCVGYDTTAGSETAKEAEAGAFQQSANLMDETDEPELTRLYTEYQAHPENCLLSTFSQGIHCPAQSIVGSGPGADFQRFAKSCPAFTAEQAAAGLRDHARHWGPLRRHKFEFAPECAQMFQQIQEATVCQ